MAGCKYCTYIFMLFFVEFLCNKILPIKKTVNGLAASAASMKTNIAQVENIIKKNNSILAKQNDTVLKLIHEISANVNEMNERVNILEQKLCTLNNSVNKNKENVTAINRKLLKLENTVNIIKTDYKKFGRPTTQGNYEERLTQLENKLKYAETKEESSSDIRENLNYDRLQKTDHIIVYIKNLPFGQNDSNDVKKLITDVLGLNVQVRNIQRAPSLYNNAGVLTVELSSSRDKEQVMRNKRKLRASDLYYDIYIDSTNNNVHTRVKDKLNMLMTYLQNDNSVHMNQHKMRRSEPSLALGMIKRLRVRDCIGESVKTCGDLRVSISREHCIQRLVIMLINSSTGKILSSTRKGYKMQTINTCLPLLLLLSTHSHGPC